MLPLNSDVPGITRAADQFKDMDENITRKIDRVLVLAMNSLFELHQQKKADVYGGAVRQEVNTIDGHSSRITLTFSADPGHAVFAQEIKGIDDVRRHAAIQDAQRNLCAVDESRYVEHGGFSRTRLTLFLQTHSFREANDTWVYFLAISSRTMRTCIHAISGGRCSGEMS